MHIFGMKIIAFSSLRHKVALFIIFITNPDTVYSIGVAA